MNTAPQIVDLPQPSERHPRSNIGRLPKKVRDQLNLMIQDGLPYDTIKQNLGAHGENLTVGMISDWKTHGGYEPWRREQIWREEMGARIEGFTELLTDADPVQISMVGLQISLAQLCEQLRDLGPGSRKEQFENEAPTYLRLLNTMARLAKSSLALQQYRDVTVKSATAHPKIADPKAPSTATDDQSWIDRADDLFGFKSVARLRTQAAAAAAGQASSLPGRSISAEAGLSPLPSSPVPEPQFEVQGSGFKVQSSPSASSHRPGAEAAASAGQVPTPREIPMPAVGQPSSLPGRSISAEAGLSPLPSTPVPAPQFEVQGSGLKVQSSPSPSPDRPGADPIENQNSEIKNPVIQQSINPPGWKQKLASGKKLVLQTLQNHVLSRPTNPSIHQSNNPPTAPATNDPPPTGPEPISVAVPPVSAVGPSAAIENRRPKSTSCESPMPEPSNPSSPVTRHSSPSEEHCLECGAKLPPLRPDGGRPHAHCDTCNIPLPPAGTCRFPSTEQCPNCKANLPRLLPSGARPDPWCHNCGTPLPPPNPSVHPPAPAPGAEHSKPAASGGSINSQT